MHVVGDPYTQASPQTRNNGAGYRQHGRELAQEVDLHHSIIGRYERDEAKPTIDVVKAMAKALSTTVGYLLGETEDDELFKDPIMLQRLKDLSKLPERDRDCILYTLDGLLQNVKAKKAFA